MEIEITLNSSTLPNSAKEYTAATIIHEALHAYFRSVGQMSQLDHEMMARSYVSYFTQTLKAIFPNLSTKDCEDLGWGGLGDTLGWNTLSQAQKSVILATNMAYKSGSVGQPCN